jgi:hypothetical protein
MNMTDFVDFLVSLAPEGETFLVVRQKPTLKDRELQFHADGAIKATWPAMLPSVKIKPDWAVYGNTASFIIDRFKDGHPSASAANCEYVLVMVLDDVGDPEKAPKLPPLEPTWKMETSPGSFQWGYVFSEQPTKDEFSAAIVAIAEAGYTDRGAINPVRNFRLPGSVNLKPGRDGFKSVLREFHPDRDFTLEQIVEAFGVVPAPVSGSVHRPIRLSDDGTDDVLIWLSENGKLLTLPNREGWAGVICPNADQHSDGNPEGRYLPTTRAFCCYHSHCGEIDSRAFLDWVAEQGGPAHTPGLRDELLAMTMESALSKLTPTEAFPDAAAAVIAEVERKEMGRLAKAEWFERFAYLQDDDAYFDMVERRYISRSAFNATFRHITCKSIRTNRVVEASIAFDELRQDKGARILVGMTYAAGEDVLCAREGLVYANRWRDARPTISGTASADPWLAHVERMIPEASEREHVLNVMACKVQYPNRKINHAILHAGKPGSGKDTMWAPFFWAVGGASLANVYQVKNDEITSQWGYSLESEVIVIQELRQAEAKDRRALENQLKPIIAAPPELLTVNRKGMHPYQALNRVFVLAFSNERVAINLPSDDRRWFVVWSDANRMSQSESADLWAWYHSGGFEAVTSWLHARDVSAFNPGASPMLTEAKAIMVEAGMSGAESFLVEMMRSRIGEFAAGVVGAPWHALCDRLQGQAPTGTKIVQGALLHAFKEAGWIDCGRLASRAYGTKKHIFCAPELADLSRSELREMVETSPGDPLMRLVK